jgi:hypothetical protein
MRQDDYFGLQPPNNPWGLPTGLDRGGVFAAPWVGQEYRDASRQLVPTNAPAGAEIISSNVFKQPVPFVRSDTVRTITRSAAEAMGAVARRPAEFYESANLPALPIRQGRGPELRARHSGIFHGKPAYVRLPTQLVPTVSTTDYQVMDYRGFGGLIGYGGSPDGLG